MTSHSADIPPYQMDYIVGGGFPSRDQKLAEPAIDLMSAAYNLKGLLIHDGVSAFRSPWVPLYSSASHQLPWPAIDVFVVGSHVEKSAMTNLLLSILNTVLV